MELKYLDTYPYFSIVSKMDKVNSWLNKNSIILDIGTWDNIEPSISLSVYDSTIFAVDRYQRMTDFRSKLAEAREKSRIDADAFNRIKPLRADVNSLPFRDSSIDLVLFRYSTAWLQQFGSEPLIFYGEVKRVLKKKGVTVVIEATVDRAEEQENFLRNFMKVNRLDTIVIGVESEFDDLPVKILKKLS